MSCILAIAATCYFDSHLLDKIQPPFKSSLFVMNTMPVFLRFVQFSTGRISRLNLRYIKLSSIIAIITPRRNQKGNSNFHFSNMCQTTANRTQYCCMSLNPSDGETLPGSRNRTGAREFPLPHNFRLLE